MGGNSRYIDPFSDEVVEFYQENWRKYFYGSIVDENGKPLPRHTTAFKVGELIYTNGCTMKVVYVNDKTVVLEPWNGVIEGEKK
jgi:hypothetical protein